MQHPRSDLLTAFEADMIVDFDDSLVDDAQLQVTVTYRRLRSSSFDAETGVQTPTEDSAADLPAIRGVVSAKRAARTPGLEIGDRIYLMRPQDLESGGITLPPTRGDQIIEGSDTYRVLEWDRDEEVGNMFRFMTRGA